MAHIVVFSGEYDLANRDGLRRSLQRLDTCDDLVFDLTEVTFIDSTFLTELIQLESLAESAVRRLFDITGLAATLTLVETYDRDDPDAVVEFAPAGDVLDGTVDSELAAPEESA